MIRKILDIIKKSIWPYPFIYGVLSLLGSFFIILIDSGYFLDLQLHIPNIFFTDIDLARMILGIVAASFITITTFTFSTTMIVLTMYMSQFSPRIVENFLTNKNTMQAFGIFVGGFIYSITSLLFMRRDLISEYLVISASISIIYMIVGLVFFLIFINSVANLIQVNNVIKNLYKNSLKNMVKYKDLIKTGSIISKIKVEKYRQLEVVFCQQNGYIQYINHENLLELAKDIQAVIVFEKVVGQFVADDTKLISLYLRKNTEINETMVKKLLSCIIIGERKTEEQNFGFMIQKIVEVALRAISPGINDPHTASHCIRILGILLRQISDLENGYIVKKDEEDENIMVVFKAFDFEKILYYTFSQLIHYAKEDVLVITSIFKALRFAMEKASKENRLIIITFSDYIWGKIVPELSEGLDYKMLKHERDEIYLLK
ncbi:DUF2254 domain-containing protein [uncultured Ilyobacter sp.]|uniref:DUF2254 domain-containing protein n=1 Tax=uncultured Ilyobacter sp. TaxID=544433 RepID=UPI0029F569FA|nr:DUF2254 domain-containing protein [uncultured Ilyobacter sp.]